MKYWLWVPLLVVICAFSSWLSVKVNSKSTYYFWINYWWTPISCVVFPIWAVISKYSKNIVLDGLIYDLTMVVAYTVFLLIFSGSAGRFSILQYVGILVALIGLILFKAG
jgi:hypothetical protein